MTECGKFSYSIALASHRLTLTAGCVHSIVASLNSHARLDDQRLIAPYRGILNRLAERE